MLSALLFGGRGCGAVKRKIKNEETTRWNINEAEVVAKWLRLAEAVEKQSRYTTCNNGANICCVGRWQWFITACELSTRETNVAPMRDEPYCSMRGTSCVFIARPGNNNRLLFITPAPNAHETLCSSPHRVWFHDSLFHRFSLRRIVILNETRVEKKITNELLQLIHKSVII